MSPLYNYDNTLVYKKEKAVLRIRFDEKSEIRQILELAKEKQKRGKK